MKLGDMVIYKDVQGKTHDAKVTSMRKGDRVGLLIPPEGANEDIVLAFVVKGTGKNQWQPK